MCVRVSLWVCVCVCPISCFLACRWSTVRMLSKCPLQLTVDRLPSVRGEEPPLGVCSPLKIACAVGDKRGHSTSGAQRQLLGLLERKRGLDVRRCSQVAGVVAPATSFTSRRVSRLGRFPGQKDGGLCRPPPPSPSHPHICSHPSCEHLPRWRVDTQNL